MFAIAPQSVQVHGVTLTFRPDGDDVAKSVLDVATGDGTHVLTFNTRGGLIDQKWVEPEKQAEAPASAEGSGVASPPVTSAAAPAATPAKGEDDGKESEAQGEDHSAEAGGEVQPA